MTDRSLSIRRLCEDIYMANTSRFLPDALAHFLVGTSCTMKLKTDRSETAQRSLVLLKRLFLT